MSDLVPSASARLADLSHTYAAAADYLRHGRAQATRRAYRSDWADFEAWCEVHDLAALPADPHTVACYLAELAPTRRVSTLERRLSSISYHHRAKRLDSPTRSLLVQEVLEGIRRRHGAAQVGVDPLRLDDLRELLRHLPQGLAGLRDRALLLVGFAGAFRRSELVGLDVEDLEWSRSGVAVLVRRSKTDQEGRGIKKGIPRGQRAETCPVRALQAWLREADIQTGPVFRRVHRGGRVGAGRLCDRAVALVVQRAAREAGLDLEHLAGHSLRSGLATEAAAAEVEERDIMAQGGWRSVQTVRRYIRDGSLFTRNAAGRVGL